MNKKYKKYGMACLAVVLLAGAGLLYQQYRGMHADVPVTAVPVAEPTAKPEEVYYWLADQITHPFYVPGIAGWNAAAADLGVEAKFVGAPEPGLADQIKMFEELLANPATAGILLYAIDFNAGEPLIQEAEGKDITVILGNSDSPFKTRSAFVGTDNVIMGQQAGGFAAEIIGCKGSVGVIANVGAGVTARAEAFRAEVTRLCPDVVAEEVGIFDGSPEDGLILLDAYMITHPDLSLLWWSDGNASYMIQSWKEKVDAGLGTLFLGTDMPTAGLEAVRDGIWIGTMGQDTFAEEYWALQFLVAKQSGLPVPDTTLLSTIIVTEDNVDTYLE